MSLPNNVCSYQPYLNLIQQRKRAQLFNIPPPRYDNLANNPYLQTNPNTGNLFTKFDLDMRRKSEILKYSNNASSTKTNNLTRAQRWAQIVRGQSSLNYSQAFINDISNTVIPECPIVYTSTTASDVPGPPILLYDASYVPLYNYTNDATANAVYAIQNSENPTDIWKAYPYYNIISSPSALPSSNVNIPSIFNTIAIQNNTQISDKYIFSVSIPFTIYVQADLSTNITSVTSYRDPNAIQIWITNPEIAIYYSSSAIQLNSDINYSLSNYNSQNNAMNISADVSINTNVTDPSKNRFYAYSYGGIINISNIKVPIQSGYVYDMQLIMNFSVSVSDNFTTYFGNNPSVYFAYLNTNYETTQLPALNCRVTNPPPFVPNPIPSFSITGSPL